MRWDQEIKAFDQTLKEYGERKADLEHRRATIRTTARHEDPKISGVKLDDIVDADDDVFVKHRDYRLAEGSLEAARARLKWFQAVADALRSQVSTERAERQLYADHGGN